MTGNGDGGPGGGGGTARNGGDGYEGTETIGGGQFCFVAPPWAGPWP
jgi:hypothetical protein